MIYVPHELIGIFRDEILQLCQIITPNPLEAELLTGLDRINDLTTAKKACEIFHSYGIEKVLLTSLIFDDDPSHLIILASENCSSSSSSSSVIVATTATRTATAGSRMLKIKVEKIEGYFSGTGDLIAALFMATNSIFPYYFYCTSGVFYFYFISNLNLTCSFFLL